MDARTTFLSWPVMRQLTGKDPLGRGAAAQSAHTQAITPRTVTADSPISRGRLCPKGSASKNLVTSGLRQTKVRYRRPFGTEWEDLDLDTAMEMIADRVVKARADTWQDLDDQGNKVRRTMGIASLGGATLDNEENYLIKKLFTAMGAIQIENQARI